MLLNNRHLKISIYITSSSEWNYFSILRTMIRMQISTPSSWWCNMSLQLMKGNIYYTYIQVHNHDVSIKVIWLCNFI